MLVTQRDTHYFKLQYASTFTEQSANSFPTSLEYK